MARKKKSQHSQRITCTFCGKDQNEVNKLIAGPNVYICDECVEKCNQVLLEEEDPLPTIIQYKPKEIKEFLDQYIIGQTQAKIVLSVAVYNHFKRLASLKKTNPPVELQKSNILLLGPTGSGKTLLAKTLARLLDVPFAMADATTLTEAGYVGEDVENILLTLLQAADYHVEKAEIGIIYIDEIDKVASRGSGPSSMRDVSGEGVQQALLKMIEGSVINVPARGARKQPHQEYLQINTSNILFIMGGAFHGIEKMVQRRISGSQMGFNAQIHSKKDLKLGELLALVEPKDLIQFGLIPEFIGRIPVITSLDELSEDDLVRILKEPKNALVAQYQKLFAMDHIDLAFTDEALHQVAQRCVKQGSGARGLRSILESRMLDIMYDIPSMEGVSSCLIDADVILNGAPPTLLYQKQKKSA